MTTCDSEIECQNWHTNTTSCTQGISINFKRFFQVHLDGFINYNFITISSEELRNERVYNEVHN